MGIPYRARVNERVFLNLPGFHGAAYVVTYVEDTSERGLAHDDDDCDDPGCTCAYNFEPRMILELSTGSESIRFGFDVDSEEGRANSLHKLDTLVAALRVFRQGLVDEFEPYDRRERELDASRE
jgi:hypothetical protein